nr:THO complex subunit 2-like isoform X2 [Ipomoea batatas]
MLPWIWNQMQSLIDPQNYKIVSPWAYLWGFLLWMIGIMLVCYLIVSHLLIQWSIWKYAVVCLAYLKDQFHRDMT